MNDEQLLRYSRHILLHEIGIEGQQRLLDSKVLIIGLGGVGSPAAPSLAAPRGHVRTGAVARPRGRQDIARRASRVRRGR